MLNTDKLCLGCMNDLGEEKICPICGYDSSSKNDSDFLPIKYWLKDRYLLGRLLKTDSNEAVYIAWDNFKDSVVTVREYFPKDVSVRNPDKTVTASQEDKYTFNGGLMSFIETNNKLAKLELPSLIPTIESFEENGTAYTVNSAFSGITLKDFIERNGGSLEWEQVRPLFLSLMDTLKELHDEGIIHGNLSTENILVGRDGKLRLYPVFYSATSPIKILNDGFSALEQYSEDTVSLTAATDVYSLSATLFAVLLGNPPPAANLRLENDSLSIPAKFAQKLPRNVLVALANGLQVLPENRTADIEGFRNELVYGDSPDGTAIVKNNSAAKSDEKNGVKKSSKKNSSAKYAIISAVCTALVFLIIGAILSLTVFKDLVFPKTPVDNSSDIDSSLPSSQVIGSVDENIEPEEKKYTVPSFVNKYYYSVIDNQDEDNYGFLKIVVKDKVFSDKYAKGTICEQSIKAGTGVVKDTEIAVTISLGPKEVLVPNVIDFDKEAAEMELLRKGFHFVEFIDMYDTDKKPGVVIQQEPAFGTKTVTDISVKVYINNYTGEDEEEFTE